MMASYGWGDDQFTCLVSLWQRESGWNASASNASSGAYGIPQALPGSKMASAGSDWQTNPATQIKWGLGYIEGRYGNPCNAWGHSRVSRLVLMEDERSGLLSLTDIRALANELNKRPTKTLGQNFVHDAGTVRRIVREAGIGPEDAVLEIGPGLGSLTLALLETGATVSAVEIDPVLAAALPATVDAHMPDASSRFAVQLMDAMQVAGVGGFGFAVVVEKTVLSPTNS